MTREEKFAVVAVYLAKLVDYLNGFEDEQVHSTFRPTPYTANVSRRKAVSDVISVIQNIQRETESLAKNKTTDQSSKTLAPLPNPDLIPSEEG